MGGKPFRILSIDGGGILGLYSARILEKIQSEFLPDIDFCDYFQLITGTSTGGIVALGLGIHKKAKEIVSFYETYGSKIFPYTNSVLHKIMGCKILFSNKYLHKTISDIADEFFEGKKMKDASCFLCIPAIDVVHCQPIVFKTPHSPKLSRDNEFLMRDIALATSAAPTYFPIYSFDTFEGLVDGGLWQNNPTLVGVYEANNYFVGTGKEYDRIEILSIGNPHSNLKRTISTKNKKSSLKKWGAKIVELPMKVSSIASDQITKLLYANNSLSITNYLRIASNNISIEHQKLCLDFASDKSLSQLKGLADHDFFNQKEKIRKFFGGIPC